ncbi:hypothetical protein D9M72_445020 [compost metagenome]
MSPEVGSISRAMQRATVDLPEPDSPTMPTVSPGRTASDTSRAAFTVRRLPGQLPVT